MSRFHYLQAEGSLHRPERTGKGNPNEKTFDNLLDGQYYQDTLTGSVYRFFMDEGETNTANGEWELLIGYDRETGSLTNFGVTLASNKIGETTSVIGRSDANPIGTITSVPAYTYVQIRAGEDIRITDIEDSSKSISLTVSQDTNAGEVSVPVQEETTVFSFGVGSIISLEASIFSAYTSADPTKIQQGVERRDLADSIGTLSSNILDSATGITSIALKDIDPPVLLEDNEKLVIKNQGGDFDIIVVNGNQTLSSTTGSITVDSFNPTADYIIDRSFVYEPSYYAGSRITQTANGVEIVANAVEGANSAIASLNVYVNNTFATTSQLSQFNTDLSNAIAGVNTYSSATYATASQFSAFQTETSNTFASVNTFANALAAEAVLKVDANGNVASIALGADSGGSSININADQIQINNIEFDKDAGTIGSDNYVAGSSGWQIKGDGQAEFFRVKLRSQDFASNSDGFDLSGAEYQFNKPISVGGFGSNPSDGKIIMRRSDGTQSGVLYGGQYGMILQDNQGQFAILSQDDSLLVAYGADNPISASPQVVVGPKLTVDTTIGTLNPSSYSGAADFGGDVRVSGTIDIVDTNDYVVYATNTGGTGMAWGLGATNDAYFVPLSLNSPDFGNKLEYRQANDRWEFSGNIYVAGNIDYVGTLTDVSDAILKENVTNLGSTLDKVLQLDAKVYDLIGEDATREIGFFAQDVEPLFPEAVSDRQMQDGNGDLVNYKSLSYPQLIPVLLEAIKDLNQKVEDLQQQLNNS